MAEIGSRGRLLWHVDSAGYEVGRLASASDVLMGRPPEGVRRAVKAQGGTLRSYYPEDTPDLYRRFVDLPDDESAIHGFVTRYGFLGVNTPKEWHKQQQDWLPRPDRTSWEAVEAIQNHRNGLAWLVDRLEKVLLDESNTVVAEHAEGVGSRSTLADYFSQTAPALFSIRLTPVPRAGGPLGLKLEPKPTTLLAVMWQQVAEAIYTGKLYRSCEVCGQPFQVGPGAGRIDKVTCSPRCQKARQRQRRARED